MTNYHKTNQQNWKMVRNVQYDGCVLYGVFFNITVPNVMKLCLIPLHAIYNVLMCK